MAVVDTDPQLGQQIVEDAKRYVLYSWSVQDAINPIAVAGADGRYFWDYEGKRYLDFITGIGVNALGYSHPRLTKVIREQAARLRDLEKALGEAMQALRSLQVDRPSIAGGGI